MQPATVLLCLTFALWSTRPAAAQEAPTDVAALRAIIQDTAKAINAHDPAGIMAHYSKEVLVSYPGIPDTTYTEFERRYREMMPPNITTHTEPVISEILVSGDLAVVRMEWDTTITDKRTGQSSHRRAKDLQVWRREGGSWKFFRGMWHHLTPQ